MDPTRVPRHVSVLPVELIFHLDPRPGEVWVDATVGGGGHTKLIAERLGATGSFIGLDQDQTMLEMAKAQLADLPVMLVQANFDQLPEILEQRQIARIDGLVADLGFASDQVDRAERGFSFREDGPLDMRMDTRTGVTAADLVNRTSEAALADIIFEFGEERHSRRIARRIVERRIEKPFATTGELADLVRRAVPRSGSIDPATRTFQALRIAVNDELGALDRLLSCLHRLLKPGGRVGIISFHSLEDRRVKQTFRRAEYWRMATKKPIEASDEEQQRNPRSRSAKLRVAIRQRYLDAPSGRQAHMF